MRKYCDGQCDQGRRCDCECGIENPITTEMKVIAILVVAVFVCAMLGVVVSAS